jgi:hypothetical protein
LYAVGDFFLGGLATERLLSKEQAMHDADTTSTPVSRRHFRDGAYMIALITLAVLTGYGVLATTARAKPTVRAAFVGAVVAAPAPVTAEAPTGAAAPGPAAPVLVAQSVPAQAAKPRSVPVAAPARVTPIAPGRPQPEAVAPSGEPKPWKLAEPVPEHPWPSPTVSGRVLDGERKPLPGASVVVRGVETRTDAEGAFTLEQVPPEAVLLVKLPGYEKARVAPSRGAVEVVLRPQAIRAAYLTYFGVGDRGIRTRVLDLTSRTELNAVVIDVKGDRGWVLYRTEVEQALAVGAQGPATLRDFDGLMADLKSRGIYTIARIVTFKDNVLASSRPDLAIIDTRTGKPWIDNEKLAWVDPFREEVWAYNIALAKEAVRRGFDEVQFDYVRFPTDGKLGVARYARPNTKDNRLPTIAGFLARARREIGPTGAFVGADIFGYTAFNENDTDIGQRIEEIAPHLDYICPMVYPSGYHKGIPGHPNPVLVPYQVVHESVRLIRKRSTGTVARIRPWLQDFKDYAFDRRIFGVSEVQAQIRGAEEAGGAGWMLWNPRNDYTGSALRAKREMAAR